MLALKDNQKTFHEEMLQLFEKEFVAGPHLFAKHEAPAEKNSGRIEKRTCWQTEYIGWFENIDEWHGLRSVIMVEAERSARNAYDGWTETRYEILPGNFGEGSDSDRGDGGQGTYRVDVSSTDRAQNNNTTALFWGSDGRRGGEPQAKGATVSFELDELGPKVEGLRVPDEWSLGGTFVSSFRLVDAITQGDRLEVLVDGERVPVWREGSSEMLGDAGEVTRDGMFSFEVKPAPIWVPRTVEVRVSDYTGLADRSDVCVERGFRRSTLALELALVAIVARKIIHRIRGVHVVFHVGR